MTAILALTKVSKRFGGLQAVRDLTFEVREGEILGLIGPNGAGKSTLFNLINGVFAPDTGRIMFAGADIKVGALSPDSAAAFIIISSARTRVHMAGLSARRCSLMNRRKSPRKSFPT